MEKETRYLMAMNLQFFAEEGEGAPEEGANEAETAEQPNDSGYEGNETVETDVSEEAVEPPTQSRETNAAFANMRREMEAAKKKAADIDALFAKQFGDYTNPETGAPIRSAQDYADAMAAQQRIQAREQLQQANIDPNLIDRMIANSPVIRQAEAATAELNNLRAARMMEEDFKKVLEIDPTKTSNEDIISDPSYSTVLDYVQRTPGLRFSDAYKLVNFDRLSSSKGEAARQAAINQVKSKNHLATGAALNVNEAGEDIPANMIDLYKETFPEKSMKELRALYNQTIANRR